MINAILGTTLIAVALMGSFYLGAHCAFRAVRKALDVSNPSPTSIRSAGPARWLHEFDGKRPFKRSMRSRPVPCAGRQRSRSYAHNARRKSNERRAHLSRRKYGSRT